MNIATCFKESHGNPERAILDRHPDAGGAAVTTHDLYVAAAYGITVLVLGCLIGWILLDQRARRRELAELEAAGVRRRSARKAPKP